MKSLGKCFLFLFLCISLSAQEIHKTTYAFAYHNDQALFMDVYQTKTESLQPCMLFVFGGAFFTGTRDAEMYLDYFKALSKSGITVAAIDYRLAFKDGPTPSLFHLKPLDNAIDIAVEDLYLATNYLLQNASRFGISTTKIMLSGSSAGAITVLKADLLKRNKEESAEILPEQFQYAGVISFAGGIFSRKGKPRYVNPPAPTLLMHGDKDQIVPYNKKSVFKLGLFGSKSLAELFDENKYPYWFITFKNRKHTIADTPMKDNLDEILWFIDEYVYKKKNLILNTIIEEPDYKEKQP